MNKAVISLTKASVLMYFRNKSSIFWSLFFPVVILFVFGFLFKANTSTTNVGVSYPSNTNNQVITSTINNLKKIQGLKIKNNTYDKNLSALKSGNIDLLLNFTPNTGDVFNNSSIPKYNVNIAYNESNAATLSTTILGIKYFFAEEALALNHASSVFNVQEKVYNTFGLQYTDFLFPGIIALSIMQAGLFGVIATIVTYKEQKILRRLIVTPLTRFDFILSQVLTYLITAVFQLVVLILMGVYYLHTKIVGNIGEFILLCILGSLIFILIGFAVSGRSKTVNSAMPIAQIISLPMMFLSGIFYPTTGFPSWLSSIVHYLPLTYLVDGIRDVATKGYSITQIETQLIGLVVWLVIGFILAVNFFKWEQ